MYFFMLWLILSEIAYYLDVRILNKFVPDVEFNEKLKINVDMTIAMPCRGNNSNDEFLFAILFNFS